MNDHAAMTHLFAQPADVLMVRDGRPFSAGADHHATGPFPPPPSVAYGALRSALLAHAQAAFDQADFGLVGAEARALGTRTQPGSLTLRGLHLARHGESGLERFYAPPLHLLTRKSPPSAGAAAGEDAHQDAPLRVALAPASAGQTDLPRGLRPLLPPAHPASVFYQRTDGLLTERGFAAVLDGGVPGADEVVPTDYLYRREPRTHVSLRGLTEEAFSGTAPEGLLFTVDFVRMTPGAGLLLGVEGRPPGALPEWVRLGGESRAASLKLFQSSALPEDTSVAARRARARASGRVVLVLTTACPSRHGWQPEAITDAGLLLHTPAQSLGAANPAAATAEGPTSTPARLVGAAVGRHEVVGGWDIAEGRPKPARRAAPAGSAFFFEDVADPDRVFDALDGRSLCLHRTDRAQGFGLVRVGVW